jgi:integrase
MTAGKRGLIQILRERIADSRGLSGDDREVLLRYSDHFDILGKAKYSDHRNEKLLRHLTRMGEEVGGLADRLTDSDAAERIVALMNTTYDNPETNRDYRDALRVFGKRLAEGDSGIDPDTLKDGVPKSLARVSVKTPKNYQPTPRASDMLDWDEDVLPMIETGAANSARSRLFAVAFEGGFRSGELYSLTVGDVSDHQYGKLIHVDGKTGERDVLVAGDAIA